MRAGIAEPHERVLLRADWIPAHLGQATQVALRSEMQKARTPSDVEGYIYAFEILGAPVFLPLPNFSSNLKRPRSRRSYRQEPHSPQGRAGDKLEPAYGPVGQAVRLQRTNPPWLLARRYGQRRRADKRARPGWAEGPVVPPRGATGAH
jgi:hypothetical protein